MTTQAEQYLLELVNRARLDPEAEADRAGIDLNADLSAGTISPDAKQALAPNEDLEYAARLHTQWMLEADVFSHTGENGSSLRNRIDASDYDLTGSWRIGENLSWRGSSGSINLDDQIDSHHGGLFLSSGHRKNIMNGSFREIGIAQEAGTFYYDGRNWNSSMVTQKFAKSGSDIFITGVVYDDLDQDNFFSIGEGRSGAVFSAGGNSDVSQAAGGYAVAIAPAESVLVQISYGGFSGSLYVAPEGENAKVDLVDSSKVMLSKSATLVSGFSSAELLGIADLDLTGSGANEELIGNRGGNSIVAGAGADQLLGHDGDDTLEGGLGADVMNGGSGSDWAVYGSSAQDIRVDMLYGGTNTGEAAGDILVRIENLLGGAQRDFFYGDDTANVLDTREGDDLLMGRGGNDTLLGGSGDDFLNGGLGADDLRGGDHGAFGDWVQYNLAASGVLVDLVNAASNQGEAAGDTFDSIENLFGSQFADTLRGDDGFNYVLGLGGADLIETRGGTDYVIAGAGNDTLDGGDQDDILLGGLGADHLIGGAGTDRAQYSQSDSGLVIDLETAANNTGEAAGDSYDSIENVYGSFFADSITGNTQANVLQGVGGADLLRGLGGDDALLGGNGFDTLEGGAGADTLSGGEGSDTASYATASAGVRADLSAAGTNTGSAAGDVYASIENLTGSAFDDALYGDGTDNVLEGATGADTLVGRDGADHLQGGAGEDILNGGAGADTLSGGSGFDLILGGAGDDLLTGGSDSADRFVFQDGFGNDTLSDFDAGDAMEQLVLSSLSAVSFTTYANFEADHLSTDGADVILTAGSDTLRLQNTSISDLDAADFVF